MRAPEKGVDPRGAAWQRLWRDRRGVVAILLALTLPMMIGLAGLAVETGLWYAMKWQNQSAADAAAVSVALELGGSNNNCADYSQKAVYAAKYNGFTPTSSTFSNCGSASNCSGTASDPARICVNTPPTSGTQTCAAAPATCNQAVEVILSQQQNTFLAAFYLSAVTIQSRSVALWGSGGTVCVLALDPTASGAVDILSGASVNLTNCWVAANSSSATSILTAGTGTPACPPSPTGLCSYDLSTVGNYGSAGIALSRPPAVTYTSPVVDAYLPWQAKIQATEPACCTPFGLQVTTSSATLPTHTRLHFASTAGIAVGMQVFDATNPAVIPAATTVTVIASPDVTMNNAAIGAGVAAGDEIYFVAQGATLSPGVAYRAPVALTGGAYNLASGVYYIYGEGASTPPNMLQGVAFLAGSAAVVACKDADGNCDSGVTIVVYGDSTTKAGSFDINCSLPFAAASPPGSLTLSAPANSSASIPAGLLFYQDPLFADTGGGAGKGTAGCQAKGTGAGPPNAVTFGSGVTLSSPSVIYTPATELDFSGSSSACTILDADRVVFGLDTGTTSLSYAASSCSTLSPSTTVAASLAE